MMTLHVDPIASIVLYVSLLLVFGLMGRFVSMRCGQPGVLGELLMGVVVGNVCYLFGMPLAMIFRDSAAVFSIMHDVLAGVDLTHAVQQVMQNTTQATQMMFVLQGEHALEYINVAYVIDIFSRFGVIFLLFMVGLDSSLKELKHTGQASVRVAILGVVAPITLGMGLLYFLMPMASFQNILFVAATLCATSVGITARVLNDLKKVHTREAKTILGAAMLDDILGLIILAIVAGVVIRGQLDVMLVVHLLISAGLFFILSFWFGPRLVQGMMRCFAFLEPWEATLMTSFLFVMCLAWLATLVQLATMIGAFVAGMILHDGVPSSLAATGARIKKLIAPLESLFAPLFFMLIGIQVKLETFLDGRVLLMATGLLVVAVLGKLVSGWGAAKGDDRLLVGIGMLPRGEVGLIFASMGKSMGVISDQWFASIVLMVLVTTLMVPPWLKARYEKQTLKSRL